MNNLTLENFFYLWCAGYFIYSIYSYKRVNELFKIFKTIKNIQIAFIIGAVFMFYLMGFLFWWQYMYIDLKKFIWRLF